MVPIDTMSLSRKVHLTPDHKRLFVYDALQFLVDYVFLNRFVGANVILILLAHDFEVQTFDLIVSHFKVVQKLLQGLLSLQALRFSIKQVVAACLVILLQQHVLRP